MVHLAAEGSPGADFMSRILPINIITTYNVMEEAMAQNVKRVVFASTNHTQLNDFENLDVSSGDPGA